MHFIGPDQHHGFAERLNTEIYPSDFAWTPVWDNAGERIDKWYHNMDSLSEAGQALATYQLDYDEEVGFAAVRKLYDFARDGDGRPFFLTVGFIHPHDPYVARPEWWDLYDHDVIDLPEPVDPRLAGSPQLAHPPRYPSRHRRLHRGTVPQRPPRLLRQYQLRRRVAGKDGPGAGGDRCSLTTRW